MTHVIAKLLGAASSSRIETLTRQVAELSVESVCQLVSHQVQSMTFSEARGYVRARAAKLVLKQARLVISKNPGANMAWADEIAREATERIIPVVIRQTGVGVPKSATPVRLAA